MKWLFVLIAALILAVPTNGYTQHRTINEVATVFAQRPVKAKCYAAEEPSSPDSFGAWGYVKRPLTKARFMHLDDGICRWALAVNDRSVPAWQRAIGALVVTHEAYHMRRWGAAGSEAKVECQAIRHWKVAARLFGATEQTVEELWPYALAEHYELTNYSGLWGNGTRPYYDPSCVVPYLYEEIDED